MNNIFEDKELGRLVVRVNTRARRFTFRTKKDGIYVTVPEGSTVKELQKAIEELRSKLLASKERVTTRIIDTDFRIVAEYFRLSVINGTSNQFLAKTVNEEVTIICPPDTDFSNNDLQTWLRKVIEESLRRRAKYLLPSRLVGLSTQSHLPFQSVKINTSKGRWGSCSARKNINLSCYLMLLPGHLIDYVLLHELAHTIEMNHSDKFWKLLDTLTGDKALQLRNELKNYHTDF